MPWIRPTLPDLDQRVEGDITSRLTGDAPLMRKAVLKILGKAQAAMAHLLHGYVTNIAKNVLADLAEEAWLERIARSRGLEPPRIAATPAAGSLILTGTNGTTVEAGTAFLSDAGLEYQTDVEVTISAGTATAAATCLTPGADGNIPDGAVLSIKTPVPGLDETATAADDFAGGADKESVEVLRERLLNFIQEAPAGGAKSDYVKWARSVAGVRNAWPVPNYYGRGTVLVIISAIGADPVPAGGLVTQVQDYIDREDIRPLTANVTVSPIVAASVELVITLRPNTAALRDAIRANLAAMFDSEAKPGGTLVFSRLAKAVSVAGIEDVAIGSIEVNGSPMSLANHVFTTFQYMVLSPLDDEDNFEDL
jgi:uncharacterized phage protein gp47/JayE